MNMRLKLSGISILCTLAFIVPVSAEDGAITADGDDVSVVIPAFSIPDADLPDGVAPPESTEVASEAETVLLQAIREGSLSKYLADVGSEDASRIEELLNGNYLEDYIRVSDSPVRFSNNAFKKPDVVSAGAEIIDSLPPAKKASSDVIGFAMSPAGIRAMSMMSREQIEAVALIAELMKNPEADIQMPDMAAGVPGLSNEDLAGMNPEQILSKAAQRNSLQDVPRVIDVGDGRDLLLANWYADTEADGLVYIENDRLPGSRIDVETGMIFGEFGEITSIGQDGADMVVYFSGGDEIRSRPAPPMLAAVPAVDDLAIEPDMGEILMSGAAPERPASEDQKPSDDAKGAASIQNVDANVFEPIDDPQFKNKPMPRPGALKKSASINETKPHVNQASPKGLTHA